MEVSLVSNPPYNLKWNIPPLAGFMPHFQGWTIPPKSNANYAFILKALSMSEKAVFLLPNGVLSTNTKEEKAIKRQLLEQNLIQSVIALPDSMFESTSIPVCIIVFNRHKETQRVVMIDMRNEYVTETRDQNGQFGGLSHTNRTYHKEVNVLTDEHMEKAMRAINNLESIKGYCASVLPESIMKQDYVLTPSRYIEQPEIEEIHRDFADIANDYNRIIRQKNEIKIRMNKTAAKRLGYDCMDIEKPDLSKSFAVVGQKAIKEDFITFSANDGIQISISTKETIHPLVVDFLNHWKQYIMYLNNEENRLLAEFRDALLPELMSGRIDLSNGGGSS